MGDSSNSKIKQTKLTDIFKRQNVASSVPNPSHSSSERIPINSDPAVNKAVDEPVANQIEPPAPCHSSSKESTGKKIAPPDISPIECTHPIVTVKTLKGYKFPRTGSPSRSFQLHWLEKFSWLEYSVLEDAAFCFACRHFGLNSTNEAIYTSVGFKDWKHATEKKGGFARHDTCRSHVQAMCSWKELLLRNENQSSIQELISNRTLEMRRYYMTAIIEVIIFLIANEVGFRGSWDEEQHREEGLFRNLFEFKLKDNEYLRKCENSMPRNATYTAPAIQNEIIAIISKVVQQEIIDEINSADVPYYSLMSDGTKDRKNTEFISIVIRYVRKAKPVESLLCFETTKRFDAQTQADLLLSTLKKCSLDLIRILSQCYDGANVMSGDEGGIQRIIQRTLGRIIPYVHCFNHKLHLVVIAALESNDTVRLFFETLKVTYSFFHRSKVQTVYKGSAICNLIVTRWAGHRRATNTVFDNYKEIRKALLQVIADTKKFDGDDIALASGILLSIQKKEFVFILGFMNSFLNLIGPADKILQSRDVSFRDAVPVIQSVKSEISLLRSQESFQGFWKISYELLEQELSSQDISSSSSRPRRNVGRPASLSAFIITDRIGERNFDSKIEMSSSYFMVIDVFLSEMERRFEDNSAILEALSEADNFDNKLLQPLAELGIKLPSDQEMVVAKNYITTRKKKFEEEICAKKERENNKFKNRFRILEELYVMREAFPEVYNLFATIETFGCSNATPECSFSALERLGNKARMSMTTDRLRQLTFLAFESKRLKNIDTTEILKIFNDNPKRRIQLY